MVVSLNTCVVPLFKLVNITGKSTAVSLLTRRLQSLGFQILIVPEAATLLFTGFDRS